MVPGCMVLCNAFAPGSHLKRCHVGRLDRVVMALFLCLSLADEALWLRSQVMAHAVCAPVAVMAQPLPMQMATAVAIPQPMQQPARQAIVTATVVQDDI